MDIGKAFSYPFEDAEWVKKLLFGALFALIPIAGLIILTGYSVQLIRNVHRGDSQPLPAWDNIGEKFVDGIKVVVVALVYLLPAIVVVCCTSIFGAVLSAQENSNVALGGAIISLLGNCIYYLLLLVFYLLIPGIYVQFARTGDIAASLRIGDVVKVAQRNMGPYLITFLMVIVGGIITNIGVIACIIGVFPAFVYATFMTSHVTGQLWTIDEAKGA